MRLFKNQHRPYRNQNSQEKIENLVQVYGTQLLERMNCQRGSVFGGWSDNLIEWATKDKAFKTQLFRFVDVFPALQNANQVYDVLLDYLDQPGVKMPTGMGFGLAAGSFAKKTVAKTIAGQITNIANNFIAGTDAASAIKKLHSLWNANVAFSVDLLGEACLSDMEADAYRQRYLDLISVLADETQKWPASPLLETDYLGAIPRSNISIKVSSLCARIKVEDFDSSIDMLYDSIAPILRRAASKNVFVNFDMEQFYLKDLTFALFRKCCERINFSAGIALQTYLRTADEDADQLIHWAKQSGRQVTVRLIKGAYWDYEMIHADQNGWPQPVWSKKEETDVCFEAVAEHFVKSMPRTGHEGGVRLALGSHNLRSIAKIQALLDYYDLPKNTVEYQLLDGMADNLKSTLNNDGHRVRCYVPIGELIPGMAYLVRRLLENTSNESWLRMNKNSAPAQKLLAAPQVASPDAAESITSIAARHVLSESSESIGDGSPFFNEPMRDFSDPGQRADFQNAIGKLAIPTVDLITDADQTRLVVKTADQAFANWASTPVERRADCLIKVAQWLRNRRDLLAGIIIREAGKPWIEADADVCEAIDFCEYYARQACGLFSYQRLGRFAGELNQTVYAPIGIAAIISPWNFPLAICIGMTSASLVTGNTVIVKPASQTPGIAKLMCEAFWESGVPRDVLQFLPGPGKTIGDVLVRDPRVALIGFTGSKEVGFEILAAAGQFGPGQANVKRVVCEMGGKNAIIVDSTADMDEAVAGVVHSAFGYAGQKCSACSRVIVLQQVYDQFLSRLIEATKTLTVGDPMDPRTDVGPVIDEKAAKQIKEYIEIGKRENKLELAMPLNGMSASKKGKPFVAPHIFSEVRPNDTIAVDEIFGPVLAVIKAETFAQALEIANESFYKLTGAVYSRTPSHLCQARSDFHVGNLYLNRGSTGALVARQPFGGFGHSGTGTKAGGSDYLKQFVHATACCENTMRSGFSPELMS